MDTKIRIALQSAESRRLEYLIMGGARHEDEKTGEVSYRYFSDMEPIRYVDAIDQKPILTVTDHQGDADNYRSADENEPQLGGLIPWLAASSLLAKYFPLDWKGQAAYVESIAGGFLQAKIAQDAETSPYDHEDIATVLIMIWQAAGAAKQKPDERAAKIVADCAAKIAANEPQKGWPSLERQLGENKAIVAEVKKWFGLVKEDGAPVTTKPQVVVSGRDYADVVGETLRYLAASNDPPQIFASSDALHILAEDDDGAIRLKQISDDHLRLVLSERMLFARIRETKSGSVTTLCAPPSDLLRTILALGRWEDIPICDIITDVPLAAANGEIHSRKGYNPATRAYLTTDEHAFEKDIASITQQEAIASANWFFEWPLSGFPFEDKSSELHALLTILQHTVMPIISDNTPLCFIDAPLRSSGKTKLATTICQVGTSRPVLMTLPEREEERAKTMVSTLLDKPTHIIFDNIVGEVKSPTLDSILTSKNWTSRILGNSQNSSFKINSSFLLTSNNGTLSTDLATRAVYIRLDPNCEKPENRADFKIKNLWKWMDENRAECIKHVLTVIGYWIANGQRLYSGERSHRQTRWCDVMGGIAESIQIGHAFLANTVALTERADEDTMRWQAFVESWFFIWQEKTVRVSDLLQLAFGDDGPFADVMWTGDEAKRKVTLGRWLQQRTGRIFSGYKIEVLTNKKHGNQYRLIKHDMSGTCDVPDLSKESRRLEADRRFEDWERGSLDKKLEESFLNLDDLDS